MTGVERRFDETKSLYGIDPVQLVNLPYWKTLEIMKVSINAEMQKLGEQMEGLPFVPGNYEKHSTLSRIFDKKKKALTLVEEKLEEINGIQRIDYEKQ